MLVLLSLTSVCGDWVLISVSVMLQWCIYMMTWVIIYMMICCDANAKTARETSTTLLQFPTLPRVVYRCGQSTCDWHAFHPQPRSRNSVWQPYQTRMGWSTMVHQSIRLRTPWPPSVNFDPVSWLSVTINILCNLNHKCDSGHFLI